MYTLAYRATNVYNVYKGIQKISMSLRHLKFLQVIEKKRYQEVPQEHEQRIRIITS